MESLKWGPHLSFPWKEQEHITLLESRTGKSWVKSKIREKKSGTCMGLMDSRASAFMGRKGLARKKTANRVWKGTGVLCVGGGLYPFWPWGRSGWNRADAPTRLHKIPEPNRNEAEWLRKARTGGLSALRVVTSLSPMKKDGIRWGRFVFGSYSLGLSPCATSST